MIAFVSPCVLPLVPGYLPYVTGITDAGDVRRGRMLTGAALFVLGFSVVFLGFFVLVGSVGVFLALYEDVLLRFAGALVIVMGLAFIGQVTFLQRTVKPTWRPSTGLAGGRRCSGQCLRSAGPRAWDRCSPQYQHSHSPKAPGAQR